MALLSCTIPDVFFGGQRGGGKSDALIGDWLEHAGRYGQDAVGLLIRRTYSELEEIERRAHQILVPLGWRHNASTHTFVAPFKPSEFAAAVLRLRYLERNSDADRYQGHNYTYLGIDEAGNFPSPEPIDKLWATLRSAKGVPCVRRLTGNPGGPGHLWLKSRYIDTAAPFQPHRWQQCTSCNEIIREKAKLCSCGAPPQDDLWIKSVFIPARLEDNVLLMEHDPGYEARLGQVGNKLLYRAWRYGDWDIIAGAAFDEWWRPVHVTAFVPPQDWPLAGGLDWGYKSFGHFALAFLGPKKRIYWRKEWYFKGIPPYKFGFLLGEKLKGWCAELQALPPIYIAGDSAMWAVTDGGQSIASRVQAGLDASLGQQIQVSLVPAPKGPGSRKTRVALWHELLAWGPSDAKGKCPAHLFPLMQFHPDCKHLIRTIPALPVAENDPEDVDTDAEDHPFDSGSYLAVTHYPSPAERKKAGPSSDNHPGVKSRQQGAEHGLPRRKGPAGANQSRRGTLSDNQTHAATPGGRRGWTRGGWSGEA